jgi:hypothetical protein
VPKVALCADEKPVTHDSGAPRLPHCCCNGWPAPQTHHHTRHDIGAAKQRLEQFGCIHQRGIAGGMTKAIIGQLQVIQVEIEQQAARDLQLARSLQQRTTAVAQARQLIGQGQLPHQLFGTQALSHLILQLLVDLPQLRRTLFNPPSSWAYT